MNVPRFVVWKILGINFCIYPFGKDVSAGYLSYINEPRLQ